MAAGWRSFLTEPDHVEEGLANVFRLGEGAPLLTLEMATATGGWTGSDMMWRVHFLGSEHEFHEVGPEQARAVLDRYVALGYIAQAADLEAPGPAADLVDAAREADAQADAAWRDVPTPPGAEDITS